MTKLPFSLIVITDWSLGARVLLERVEASLAAAGPGTVAIQHRHKEASDRQQYDEGRQLASVCARYQAPLFVNGRLDLALALDAHLHCTSTSLPPLEARPHLAGKWVSTVVHHEGDVARGADLALVSPVFPAGSKPDDVRSPLGVEGYSLLARRLGCPAFALGGITPETLRRLEAPGAAVISSVLRAADSGQATRALLAALTAS